MTRCEAERLECGVYRIYWSSGGSSVASVGCNHYGDKWLMPANWVVGPTYNWHSVERVELIEAAHQGRQ